MNDGNMAEGSAHLSPVTSNPINDFMGQMAQAYAALQRVPELEGQLKAATEKSHRDGDHIAELELRIHSYKSDIDHLQDDRRSLEVERDNAQFHSLELEERLGNLTRSLNNVFDDLGAVSSSLVNCIEISEGPKPEPEVSDAVQGQSDPLPIASSTDSSTNDASPSANPTTGALTSSVPLTASDNPGVVHVTEHPTPYAGKAYAQFPQAINREEWLAGGGTDYGYDWRSYQGPINRDLLYPAGDLHVSDGKPESQSFTEYSGEHRTVV